MAGPYAEACHIKPLGRPHNGPDTPENILCLCPNCHVLFDEFALWINDDLSIEGREDLLRVDPRHVISLEVLWDHRRMCGR
jgi:putative restriction endonuclease